MFTFTQCILESSRFTLDSLVLSVGTDALVVKCIVTCYRFFCSSHGTATHHTESVTIRVVQRSAHTSESLNDQVVSHNYYVRLDTAAPFRMM